VDVDAIAVQGIWWRQAPHGGDPLFRADPPSDGCLQRGDTVGGLYFADNEQTAWAEWYRALAELAVPPDRQMPRDLWRWQVDVGSVADLSDVDRLVAVGLEAPRPVQRQWSAFQALGEGLWREGLRGILAPSAARPTCRVLCLFREAHEVTGATPLRPPITYRHGPAPPIGMTT
jgi:RES domain-containing protein